MCDVPTIHSHRDSTKVTNITMVIIQSNREFDRMKRHNQRSVENMPSQMQRAAGEETERNIDNDSDIEIINTHEDTNTAAITDCDCMNCSAFGSFFFCFSVPSDCIEI